MAEVIERGVAAGRRSQPTEAPSLPAAEAALHGRLIEQKWRRAASATWQSSLGPQDLACLQSVIETQVLPSLLRSYRPAERMPLKLSGLA